MGQGSIDLWVCSGLLSPECEARSAHTSRPPEGGEQSCQWCQDLKLSERVALGYCLELNGCSLSCGGEGGGAQGKD